MPHNDMEKVVTRFAPSPTGFMHVGGARTALFAYLWARKNNGTFILRIEDTDKEREVSGAVAHIQETLTWLGLEWDYGPDTPGPFGSCIQSERLDTYKEAAQELIARGLAYPDPYTEEQANAFREEAKAAGRPFLYRDYRPTEFGVWDGTSPLRFKVPEVKRYTWTDAVRGELTAGEEALDDFILIKGDGYPTYNFAHIIDDHHMGVTHIFRGDEFISSTPRFLSLYDALGFTHPTFVTLPPILREDKTKKLSKRDGAKDILDYRAEGYIPDAVVNFLAFIGWNPGTEQEIYPLKELITGFDISQIQTHGGTLNEEKLLWYNRAYLLAMDETDFAFEARKVLKDALTARGIEWNEEVTKRIIPIIKERTSVWEELRTAATEGEYDLFFMSPDLDASLIPGKAADATTAARHLAHVAKLLRELSIDEHDAEAIKNAVWGYANDEGRGEVLWPLRYALSGKERSPDPFTIIAAIGIDDAQLRIQRALETLEE